MKKETGLTVIIVSVLTVGADIGAHYYQKRSARADTTPCVAGPGEQCPSDQFMQDYNLWQSRMKEYLILKANGDTPYQKVTDLEDMINGQATRLNNAIRDNPGLHGYIFDESKKKFVRMAPPSLSAPMQQPAPITNSAVPAAPVKP